ncbi:MAG: hypothetical protein ACOH1J_04495 [Microbacteriaceae bacterium]
MVTTRTTSTNPPSVSLWRGGLVRFAVVAVVASGSVVAGVATPAFAAGEILVSSDGNSWGTSMPQDLFVSTALLIPEASQTQTMYVRNSGTSAGYLRISLKDVVINDASYGDALKVSASVPGYPGTPVSVSSAAPCIVLTQGLLVAPGATVPITASIGLDNLTGTVGQNEAAGLNLSITLSEGTTTGMQPTQCLPNDTVVVVTPPAANGGGAGSGTSSANGGGAEADTEVVADGPSRGDVVVEIPLLPPFTVNANTQELFEQLFVFGPYAAMILGTGIFFAVARRRRKDDDDEFDDLDESAFGNDPAGPGLADSIR